MELVANQCGDLFQRHPLFKTWRRVLGNYNDYIYYIDILPRPINFNVELVVKSYRSLSIGRTDKRYFRSLDLHKGIDLQVIPFIERIYGKELGLILFDCDFGLKDPKVVNKLNEWFDHSGDLRVHGIPAMYLFDDNQIFTEQIRKEILKNTTPIVWLTMEKLIKDK